MITITLDDDDEQQLSEILACEDISQTELVKRLIHLYWLILKSQQLGAEPRGERPQSLLQNNLSELLQWFYRKQAIVEYFDAISTVKDPTASDGSTELFSPVDPLQAKSPPLSFLGLVSSLQIEGPPDWSTNLDYYLYAIDETDDD